MFRGKRLALLLVGVTVILGAAAYGLARPRHTANPGPYAAVIERLHDINHQLREIQHSYSAQHQGEQAFERWHDLLHEQKDLLHTLPEALQGVTPEKTGTADTLQESALGASTHRAQPRRSSVPPGEASPLRLPR